MPAFFKEDENIIKTPAVEETPTNLETPATTETPTTFTTPSGVEVNLAGEIVTPTDVSTIGVDDIKEVPTPPNKQPDPTIEEDISGLEQGTVGLTPEQERAQEQSDRFLEVNKLLSGQEGFKTEQEVAVGLPEKEKAMGDLNVRLRDLQRQALAIPIQISNEFRGRASVSQQAGITKKRRRENAIESLQMSALIDASQNSLTSAQRKVDRAVEAKYGDLIREKQSILENLEVIMKSPKFTEEQKKRADAESKKKQAELDKVESEKAEQKEIWDLLVQATPVLSEMPNGTQIMEKIRNAGSKEEALAIIAEADAFQQEGVKEEISSIAQTALENGADSAILERIQGAKTVAEAQRIASEFVSPLALAERTATRAKEKLQADLLREQIATEQADRKVILDKLKKDGESVGIVDAEFGTPEYIDSIIANSAEFDGEMIGSQVEMIQQSARALSGLESLNQLLFQGEDGLDLSKTGAVKGRVRELFTKLGADADASAINATIQGLIPTVARGIFGEVGVLTDTDIENYKKTIPTLKASGEANKLVTIIMLDVLQDGLESTLVSNANNQKDVSRFAPMVANIRERVAEEKAKLGITSFTAMDNNDFLDTIPDDEDANSSSTGFVEFDYNNGVNSLFTQ